MPAPDHPPGRNDLRQEMANSHRPGHASIMAVAGGKAEVQCQFFQIAQFYVRCAGPKQTFLAVPENECC